MSPANGLKHVGGTKNFMLLGFCTSFDLVEDIIGFCVAVVLSYGQR